MTARSTAAIAVLVISIAFSVAVAQTPTCDDCHAQPADPPPPRRPFHGSIGVGGDLLLTGSEGDRNRLDAAFDFKFHSRLGVTLSWRAIEPRATDHHRGLVMGGLVFEGAASRPRLVLDLHGELGADLDARRPLFGGGIRPTLGIIGPLGLVFDSGLYFVIDGFHSRLQLQTSTLLVARW